MTTAICLLTADRAGLTEQTVRTLADCNDLSAFMLLHADDGSEDGRNEYLAETHGFETVYRHPGPQRAGQIPALKAMWSEAAKRGADWILHLENDQEFVGPLPSRRDADSVRLYGELKAHAGSTRARASDKIWGTQEVAQWSPAGDGWERGVIHWGAQPSITRTEFLLAGLANARRVHDIPDVLNRLDTLRPISNITWHADPDGTTPRHWLGKDKCKSLSPT